MKRNVLAVFMASMMAASLLGCASQASQQTEAGAKAENTTVRMWTFLDPTNKENGRSMALQQMIDEFEAGNPGVKIVVEPQDWATMTGKFLAASAVGDAPDIMWCARDEMYGVLNAGALEPLENLFMGDWSEEEIADVDDAFFRFGERNGNHYTLTLNKNCTGLLYRENLLKENGLLIPTTFEELYDTAHALTGKDTTGIQRYGLGMSFSTESNDAQALVNWLLQENGGLFNEDGTADWANDGGVTGVNWIKNCIDTGVTPSESVNTTIEDIYTEFSAGKYAMAIGSAVRLANLRSTASFDGAAIQFTPLPGGTIIDGWFVGVWSGSKHKEEAGRFLESMYSPESDLKWIQLGGQAPCRKSTLKGLEITEENKYMEAMVKAFGEGWLPSNTEAYVGWKLDLNYPIQNVLTEGADPLAALKDAEVMFNTNNNR